MRASVGAPHQRVRAPPAPPRRPRGSCRSSSGGRCSGEPITLFGDGAQERDCLYVDDVVECLLLDGALDRKRRARCSTSATTSGCRSGAIAEAVVAAAGSGSVESVPWPHDRDAIDIGSYYGDSSKAKRVLGWEPRTSFADGIAHDDRRSTGHVARRYL